MTTRSSAERDKADMDRMGFEQELKRNFSLWTLLGFALLLGNTWPYALIGSGVSLQNGGPAGGIWMLCFVLCGMGTVTCSLAELASMYPTSGAQYYWVGQLAPERFRNILSYCVAWLSFIGWQVGMSGTCFSTGEQMRGVIALLVQSYEPKPLHSMAFCILVAFISVLMNILCAKRLPNLEGWMVIFYLLGLAVFVGTLLAVGPHSDAKAVFFEFQDPSGWGNTTLATFVGMMASIFTLGSGDSATHLAEEIRDASRVQPKAMIRSFLLSGFTALLMTIVNFLRQGNDYNALLNTPFGQPWIQTLVDATGSTSRTAVLVVFVCILLQAGCINQTTTTSRQTYAIARARGLPFSAALSFVRNGIPMNSVILTFIFTLTMSVIPLFSQIAFNIIVSLSMISLYTSYLVTIICSAWRRSFGGGLPHSEFSIGKAGPYLNLAAIGYLSLAIVFLCFPSSPDPSLAEMNWACVMFTFAVLFSLVYYFVSGRRNFKGAAKPRAEEVVMTTNQGGGKGQSLIPA